MCIGLIKGASSSNYPLIRHTLSNCTPDQPPLIADSSSLFIKCSAFSRQISTAQLFYFCCPSSPVHNPLTVSMIQLMRTSLSLTQVSTSLSRVFSGHWHLHQCYFSCLPHRFILNQTTVNAFTANDSSIPYHGEVTTTFGLLKFRHDFQQTFMAVDMIKPLLGLDFFHQQSTD